MRSAISRMTPKRCVVQAVFDSCWHSREADAPIRLTFGLVELAPGLSILPQPSHYGQGRGLKMRKANTKHEPVQHASGAPGSYLSADERRAAGKALRDVTPRAAHGGWKPPEDRRDPVELLREANEGRIAELIPLRFSRMAQSPFAFYRGAAAIMAADLASTPTSGLRVQACGDAHLMSFGGFATPERNIFFDINFSTKPCRRPGSGTLSGSRPALSSRPIISTCPSAGGRRRRRNRCARTVNEWRIMPRCARSMSGTTASISIAFSRLCRPAPRWRG